MGRESSVDDCEDGCFEKLLVYLGPVKCISSVQVHMPSYPIS